MILSYVDLVGLIDRGVIRGVSSEHVNGSSIDLTISDQFLLELPNPTTPEDEWPMGELSKRQPLYTELQEAEDGLFLVPKVIE